LVDPERTSPTANNPGRLVSNGSGRPYKLHVRSPGIPILSGLAHMITGSLLADLVPTFDSLNMIGGEVEQ
jgi:NADH-quinone oxidoreductase subunit D